MPFSHWLRPAVGLGALGVFVAAPFGSGTAFAQQTAPPAKITPAVSPSAAYLRDIKNKDGSVQAAQTAIRRFDPISGSGPTVYLVAAVHIGEKDYYKRLQSFLDKQDVVLYERVKPPRAVAATQSAAAPTTPPTAATDPAKTKAPVSAATPTKPATAPVGVQKQLSDVMHLQFQLDGIDYNRPNFRNSDLAWDDMESLAAKSGTGTQQSLTTLKNTLNGGLNSGPMGAAFNTLLTQARANPAVAAMLRRVIVELISNPDRIAQVQKQQGPEQAKLQTIIVTERNKAVLADLKTLVQTTPAGDQKPVHSVAVFYGAEHMQDMAQHLVSDMGYRPATTEWITAMKAAP